MHLQLVAKPGILNFSQAFASGLALAVVLAAAPMNAQDKREDPEESESCLVQFAFPRPDSAGMHTSVVATKPSIAVGRVIAWPESGFVFEFDNFASVRSEILSWWSINDQQSSLGWFYAYTFPSVEITHVPDIKHVSEIGDASALDYSTDWSVGPVGVGDFVVLRNLSTGFYAALRIDDIPSSGRAVANVTWYLQEDGSADFSSHIFFDNFESGNVVFWSNSVP